MQASFCSADKRSSSVSAAMTVLSGSQSEEVKRFFDAVEHLPGKCHKLSVNTVMVRRTGLMLEPSWWELQWSCFRRRAGPREGAQCQRLPQRTTKLPAANVPGPYIDHQSPGDTPSAQTHVREVADSDLGRLLPRGLMGRALRVESCVPPQPHAGSRAGPACHDTQVCGNLRCITKETHCANVIWTVLGASAALWQTREP
jgi:hypothetical protein